MKRIIALVLSILCCFALTIGFNSCKQKANESGDVFYMEYKGTKIELGAKADGVISALGEAKSVKELGDCGGLGAQVKYTYSDIELYTLKSADGESVDGISFTSDLVSTSKGISIGDSSDKVTEVYGQPTEQSSGAMIYTEGNMSLKFKLSNGVVSAIDYLRTTK